MLTFFMDWKVFLFLLFMLMVAHVTQAAVGGLKPAKSGFCLPLLVADKAENIQVTPVEE